MKRLSKYQYISIENENTNNKMEKAYRSFIKWIIKNKVNLEGAGEK